MQHSNSILSHYFIVFMHYLVGIKSICRIAILLVKIVIRLFKITKCSIKWLA